MTTIAVAYTCSCVRCGAVNIKNKTQADKEMFEQRAQQDPSSYWKEDLPTGVMYRQHEESSKANCRYSCQ